MAWFCLSICSLMPCSLQQGDDHGRSLHLSLSIHSFLACSIPPALLVTLLCLYSSILSSHLITGLPLLETSFPLTTLFFLSIWPNNFKRIYCCPFHYTTTPFAQISFIYTFIALILLSGQITNFHSSHSWLLCSIVHVQSIYHPILSCLMFLS